MAENKKWREWALLAQQGDQNAYRKLLTSIMPVISGYLAKKMANPVWVDDVMQDVLISIHKSLHTYDPDQPFMPWLMAITNFRHKDFLRNYYRQNRDQQTSLENPEFIKKNVTETAFAGEYKDVETILSDLPDKQRQVFEMMKLRGYTAKDVSKKTGMTIAAVKVSVHRTMQRLKDTLG